MPAIFEMKEQAVVDTPLMVFDCQLPNGQWEHWSTHRITAGEVSYEARILEHSSFDIQTASDQGIDGSPQISIVLANADSHFSEIERATGWKGARLKVGFLFYDLRNGVPLTEVAVIFQGICNPPDRSDEATFRITALNRMSLQRVLLPQVRIQRRCPWEFPRSAEQRTEAMDGGSHGKYSMFYRCGYSAGVEGGLGNLNGDAPYSSCGYTRGDCQARGMFSRFGGLEFVPPAVSVRGYGKDWTTSAVAANQARYNDYVPMVYGTAWQSPTVVFARNDGNLTRMEVLLGVGEIEGVVTVLVNDVEIPQGVTGSNMTGTGWYNVETLGGRDGHFDNNFTDGSNTPSGDPYGSMAYLSVVVPNRINSGTSLPSVKVLMKGLRVPIYEADGSLSREEFSSNPAWILLDVLRRSGWSTPELDIPSFARVAAYCEEEIQIMDPNGNPVARPRFECNLLLQHRRSAGDVVRGVRNCARMFLTYGPGGALQARVENTLALERPSQHEWSNSVEALNGGWPAYEFGDGTAGYSGILRRANGDSSVRLSSRSIADTPNRFTVEFQDALNGYQQDSFEMVDAVDAALTGQLTSTTLMALGLPHYDQAARVLKFNLDKSLRGNTYVEFQTSVKGFGIGPGDLITITYIKEGFFRQPFRVLRISPATNYRTATITAQLHDDDWYLDTNGRVLSPSGVVVQEHSGFGLPKPLQGSAIDEYGDVQYEIEGVTVENSDGTAEARVTVSFVPPPVSAAGGPGVPRLSVSPIVTSGGGSLYGGQILYYAVSAVDVQDRESSMSFLVRAIIAHDGSCVELTGLSFALGTVAFHVYRGLTPAQLTRIASNQSIAGTFTDTGIPNQLIPPPDSNFDHANFYWRSELQPEIDVMWASATSVANSRLHMATNGHRGMTVRITRGKGAGQERAVLSNTATEIWVRPWDVKPDESSFFGVAEAGWHFGALAKSSPVQFAVPNRTGEVVQILGRAANVNDGECAAEISTVTRWVVGGSLVDGGTPEAPFFGLDSATGGGAVVLRGVSFADLVNTASIASGTLTLHYWNELLGLPSAVLASAVIGSDQVIALEQPGPSEVGSLLQIDGEILEVTGIANGGTQCEVARASHGSPAANHSAGAAVYLLSRHTAIVPFPPDFFGSPYSANWSFPISLPDVRIGCAELFVSNRAGKSPTTRIALTHNDELGIRTLSGGQYSIQVDGFLSVETCVAPAIVVESSHAVRDVFAVLGSAADSIVTLQVRVDGQLYCQLTFEPGALGSDSVLGGGLPPLTAMSKITVGVSTVGRAFPGADLTVLIRL